MAAESWPDIPGLRLLEPLGRGGMGRVVLAEEVGIGRRVAVKWIDLPGDRSLDEVDPTDRERFEREARALARLDHPHLLKVHRLGESEGRPYMVLELVEGGSLSDRIRERGALPVPEALEIARQAICGLGAAWDRGLVHRDVKPANLLFDREGRVRVADFGLARAVDDEADRVTRTGFIVGSPHYMSPEQIRGEDLDLRSDLYSLGVVLFEMLSGSPPFDGRSQGAILAGHLSEPLPDLRAVAPGLPEPSMHLVERLTAKEPQGRPASGGEALAVIERALLGAPTHAETERAAETAGGLRTVARQEPAGRREAGAGTTELSSGAPERPVPSGSGSRREGQRRGLVALAAVALIVGVLSAGGLLLLHGGERGGDGGRPSAPASPADDARRDAAGQPPPGLPMASEESPPPLDIRPGGAAPELARALTARGAEIGTAASGRAGSAIDPLDPPARGVRVRLASSGHPLLFHLRADGDLELLHPPPGTAPEPLGAGERRRLPGPSGAASGWLVLAATAEPLEPPTLLGARPVRGRVLYPARLAGATGEVAPAHDFVTWLFDNLGVRSGPWGLAVRPLSPGGEAPSSSP